MFVYIMLYKKFSTFMHNNEMEKTRKPNRSDYLYTQLNLIYKYGKNTQFFYNNTNITW